MIGTLADLTFAPFGQGSNPSIVPSKSSLLQATLTKAITPASSTALRPPTAAIARPSASSMITQHTTTPPAITRPAADPTRASVQPAPIVAALTQPAQVLALGPTGGGASAAASPAPAGVQPDPGTAAAQQAASSPAVAALAPAVATSHTGLYVGLGVGAAVLAVGGYLLLR